jgi:hypothetical protein
MKTQLLAYLGRGPGRSTRPVGLATSLAYLAGAALVVWSAYIHYHLWGEPDGYRQIPTIGPLFLAQSIGGLVIGIVIVAFRRVWAAIVGVGFGVSTIIGFYLCVELPKGLFNFKETTMAPFASEALGVEIALAVVLLLAAALSLAGSTSTTRTGSAPTGIRSADA